MPMFSESVPEGVVSFVDHRTQEDAKTSHQGTKVVGRGYSE